MILNEMIKNTSEPQTIDTLVESLKKLGLYQGDTVIVHASLSKIGYVIGGIETLFKAILKVVGALGTIIVPTQTMDNSDPKNWQNPAVPESWHDKIRELIPAYDKKTTPTRSMGKFAEYIRNYPGTERSSHPQVSFAAFGFHAKKIVKTHVLTPKFGMQTPLGALYNLDDVKILMIGTDATTNTSLHLAEALSTKYKVKETSGCAMNIDNKRQWVTYEDKAYDSDQFVEIETEFLKKHKVNTITLGLAETKLYQFKKIVDFAVGYLDK
ncbi:Aminoglycoside N(3\')-acetyltransferase [Alteracholeplasma palmae J233]|uniref:Aminoglycoside N(3)-acetyltransferase n=1 Tax=Alteracholeplasma palmae (strain ATCC 49389 / J233) TaxID=1318466 RepID=U4KL72_ALTPJ|nr:AAC(3) family N-acetyltransferase [Alteracholeplasma palmae]CCV64498.1 Aminoglycoside N(3\')-acetyltransferase [Alteracholeplasma palmae J233]